MHISQVVLDQPGDELGLVGGQAQARAEPARDLGAGDRMVLRPALGDVVQQQRQEQRPRSLMRRQDLARQRMVLGRRAGRCRDSTPIARTGARPPCSGGTC